LYSIFISAVSQSVDYILLCKLIHLNLSFVVDRSLCRLYSVWMWLDRHSRLATLLHKLADALKTDGRAVSITEKPRPLSLTSGAISDVEVGKVSLMFISHCSVNVCFAIYPICMQHHLVYCIFKGN